MTDTRERRTKKYDDVLKTFHENFIRATTDKSRFQSQSSFARYIGVSKSAVARWMSGDGLPTVDQLVLIAEYFNVSPEWFLSKHEFTAVLNTEVTYAGAALTIKRLIDLNAVEKDCITDYFIKYLVDRISVIDNRRNVSKEKKDAWMQNMKKNFDVPVLQSTAYEHFKSLESELGEINEDDTVIAVLHAYQDETVRHDEGWKLVQKWVEEDNKKAKG